MLAPIENTPTIAAPNARRCHVDGRRFVFVLLMMSISIKVDESEAGRAAGYRFVAEAIGCLHAAQAARRRSSVRRLTRSRRARRLLGRARKTVNAGGDRTLNRARVVYDHALDRIDRSLPRLLLEHPSRRLVACLPA